MNVLDFAIVLIDFLLKADSALVGRFMTAGAFFRPAPTRSKPVGIALKPEVSYSAEPTAAFGRVAVALLAACCGVGAGAQTAEAVQPRSDQVVRDSSFRAVEPSLRYDAPGRVTTPLKLIATKSLCSFGGETRVLMADGSTKPISEVEVGDMVLAQDPESGEIGARRVTDAWVHDDDLVRLEIDGDVVRTTEDHRFWNDTDKQWQRADQLDTGDYVLNAEGRRVKTGVLIGSAGRGSAYNFTVEGLHTYHVLFGEDAVLVHNECLVALKDWTSQRFQFGDSQFLLDKKGMSHILQRHHPDYWDGSTKATQSFFDKSMSIGDVEGAVGAVMRQNHDELIRIGSGNGKISRAQLTGFGFSWVFRTAALGSSFQHERHRSEIISSRKGRLSGVLGC